MNKIKKYIPFYFGLLICVYLCTSNRIAPLHTSIFLAFVIGYLIVCIKKIETFLTAVRINKKN